jgi:hypothetical protein
MVTIAPSLDAKPRAAKSVATAKDGLQNGLTSDEARGRPEEFGPNAILSAVQRNPGRRQIRDGPWDRCT